MDDVKIGRVVRALRRRRGWRQTDLGHAAHLSQDTISLIERGHVASLSLETLRRVMQSLDVAAEIELRWRGAALDRLLDERHASVMGAVAARLVGCGWKAVPEVTYAHFGERGSIDILAWHEPTASLLVVEVKSELVSLEATLRKLDEKARLAPTIARERFGWSAHGCSRLLVLPDTSTQRARVRQASIVLNSALPSRGHVTTSWLKRPAGSLAGLWFLLDTNPSRGTHRRGGSQRVRAPRTAFRGSCLPRADPISRPRND